MLTIIAILFPLGLIDAVQEQAATDCYEDQVQVHGGACVDIDDGHLARRVRAAVEAG